MDNPDAPFETFVIEHQAQVYGQALRMLGNPAEAQDISQETFLRAFRHFESIRGRPEVRGWLKTVVRNLCLNHMNRYRSRWRLFSDWFSPTQGEDPPKPEDMIPSPEPDRPAHEKADRRALLETLLARLPDHQRAPLVMFHFDEMTYEEIADALGVSLGKVKTDIHRARHALKKKIAAHEGAREEWPDALSPGDAGLFESRLYAMKGAWS